MTRTLRTRGLTLVELVVVLLIMVVVASVALQSTSRVVDQGRFDATTRQLVAIEDAVLGEHGVPGPGSPAPLAGFVADTGGLPRLLYSSAEVAGVPSRAFSQLGELWSRFRPDEDPALVSPRLRQYQLTTAAAIDTEVVLGVGWRGPYLRLPPSFAGGDPGLKDGWGRAFEFSRAPLKDFSPSVYSRGEEIFALRSLGSNSGDAGDPFARAFELVFADADVNVPVDRAAGRVSGTVSGEGPGGGPDPLEGTRLLVVVFGPDPDTGGLAASYGEYPVTGSPLRYSSDDPAWIGPAITIGPRVVRAYQGDAGMLLPTDAGPPILRARAKLLSAVVRVEVRRGAPETDLVMRFAP